MMRKLSDYLNKSLRTIDDKIGKVVDLYFDDRSWQIMYCVVAINVDGEFRRILVAPYAISNSKEGELVVQLTSDEIRECLTPSGDKRIALGQNYRISTNESVDQSQLPVLNAFGTSAFCRGDNENNNGGNKHFCSCQLVAKFDICAEDGKVGTVADLLIDDKLWVVRSIIFKPGAENAHQLKLLDIFMLESIEWGIRSIVADEKINNLLLCPVFDPERHLNIRYEDFIGNQPVKKNTRTI